jgi:hypothetical protein
MSADIQTFLANFAGGGARNNLYRVILTFPQGIGGDSLAASTKAGFLCKAAAIPSSNIGVIDVPYMGRQVKIAGDKVWDDWNITVLNDTDFVTRNQFERWSNAMNGHVSNVSTEGMENPLAYMANATVQQLGRYDQVIATYKVTGIFPSQVAEIQLGSDANDQIQEFSVTFACNGWEHEGVTS